MKTLRTETVYDFPDAFPHDTRVILHELDLEYLQALALEDSASLERGVQQLIAERGEQLLSLFLPERRKTPPQPCVPTNVGLFVHQVQQEAIRLLNRSQS